MQAAGRTALAAARTRFIDELDERADQLRNATRLLGREPYALDVLSELERRLRSLHAAAELCGLWQLAGGCVGLLAQIQSALETRQDPATLIAGVVGLADTLDAMSERANRATLPEQAPHVAAGSSGSDLELTQTVTGMRAPQPSAGGTHDLSAESSANVDAIAARVAEEIRRGIVSSLQAGRDEGAALSDPGALVQAAWSAVDRVRAQVVGRAAGGGHIDSGADSLASKVSANDSMHATAAVPLVLLGRTVLVADDDPAVLSFFAGLLRDAGAHVLEAKNGRDALALARALRPVLVISDILMPKLDGFTLCRELKRDLILSHVPVVLSSWKEDFLQRMRELEAGAAGYVRKESGAAQVMQTVLQVLGPRLQLEAALRDQGVAQGNVQAHGCLALIEAVAEGLRDARVLVNDSWNVFEVHVSGGERMTVTRTASDGTFTRGEEALLQLLGVANGRFELRHDATVSRGAGSLPLSPTLLQTAHRLGALMDAVSDTRLLQVATVVFDDAVLPGLLEATPTHVAYLVSQLRSGEMSARELISTGQFPARELETQLLELARRGAILAVRDEHGDDLVTQALKTRELDLGVVLHASLPPPATHPTPGGAAGAGDDLADELGQRFSPEELEELAQPATHAPFRAGALESAHLDAELDRVLSRPPPPRAPLGDRGARGVPKALAKRRSVATGAVAAPVRRRGALGLVLTLVLLMGVGYLGWLTLYLRAPLPGTVDAPPRPAAPARKTEIAVAPAAEPPRVSSDRDAAPVAVTAAVDESISLGLGRALPFIDRSRGVEVAADEGLLVIEHEGRRAAPKIRVDARDLGRAPIATALAAGRHEIVIDRAGRLSYRYLVIRPGETRVVELSTEP